MNVRFLLLAAPAAVALSFASPASADGMSAHEYVANLRQQIAFLDQASRLAGDHSQDEQIRAFATAEMADLRKDADALKAWETGNPTGGVAIASSEFDEAPGTIVTGRSVAVDDWHGDAGTLMPSPGVVVLPRLSALSGDDFDTLYAATQTASLRQLAAFYEAYGKTGEDPALKAMALSKLPLVRERLSKLDAL